MKSHLWILACFAALACTRPEPAREIKTTTELRAGQWVSCWEMCGKGDMLIAITETHCKCRKGKSFPHGFELIKKEALEAKPEEPSQSRSVFEMLGIGPIGQ